MASFSRLLIRYSFIGLILLLFAGNEADAQDQSTLSEADPQRYLALMSLNLTVEKGSELDLIKLAKQNGLNSVYLTIPWDKVYINSPTETPNWPRFDEQIQLATSLGMKVAIRIHLGRAASRINGFWEPSDSQFSNTNVPALGGYLDTYFGFDNRPIVNRAAAFVKEVTERYKYLQTAKNLLFISVTNTPTQEGEYPVGLIADGKDQSAIYDYSPRMVKGFQAWLKANYKKIERLNFLWGTNYKTFDEAPAPATNWDVFQSFRQRYGKDWYIYRHLMFKQYLNQMISTVKSVDPTIKFVSDHGSVFDGLSALRGTLAYKDLNENADGIKVNNGLAYDHRWAVDILRSDAPASFIAANEVFPDASLDNATHLKQINENFENGANVISVVISTTGQMQQAQTFLQQASANWLNKPIVPIQYADEVSYKLSAAVEKSGATNVIYSEWARRAYADPANPKPVRIKLDEDLLSPDYWNDASNYAPYVFRPIPMQIIQVNKDFNYALPTDTFSDVDGTIVRMDAGALPAWLTYEAGRLKGKPTVLGDYRILVKGIDDEGGISEAYFTIRVDTKENANKPPTVNSNFSNQTIAIDKAFNYTIPKDAFLDADGTVTKVEVSELPSWLAYTNGALSGTPNVLGSYRVIIKAYDDLNAFVETYFTIKVVEPQFLNNAPFAQKALPVKYANVNQPFNYILPSDIFGDTDGYISTIALQNRPSWLDFSLNVFSGTPTQEGDYRLIIRAYDNGGAYVEIPFILRVEIPKLTFELARGGSAVNQQVLRTLGADDVIPYDSLPPLINIFAYGNFEFDQVHFDLKGPQNISSSTSKFPYALFENTGGFTPFVGRYTLTVTATNKDSAIISNSIQFSISYGSDVDIARDIKEWQFYPNPVETVLNIKLPADLLSKDIEYYLIHSSGKKMPLPVSYIQSYDQLISMDLSSLGISSGIYFVRLESNGALLHQFKIFKK
ncbi:putative Ig domain-containing protein [Dyadobacter sp. NIV53]|uniref:putative Ig domain-containing protein n=1 Tax=Dyadobacter sp. NIV53 TaxID=2861765 RepID=UPI001C865C25|nr:putative Ig domain-containing protein [Dyadobacter sp. NIV53]